MKKDFTKQLAVSALALALGIMWSGVSSAEVYPGCTIPATSFTHVYNATPETLALMLKKAVAGDKILLSSGNYGALNLSGKYSNFLTIAASPGQTPVFSKISIGNSSHIALRGVTITSLRPLTSPALWGYVLLTTNSSDNIIMDSNVIASRLDTWPWLNEPANMIDASKPDWTPLTPEFTPADGINAGQSNCIAITNNHIYNVLNAVAVSGDQIGTNGKNYLIANNTINDFAWDGIDHGVSNELIKGNSITNSHGICIDNQFKCPHTDAIQGWNYEDKPGLTDSNVVIDSNLIMTQTSANFLLPNDDMHGISIFDGHWTNVTVSNNIVVTNTYDGIYITGTDGAQIVNNVVLGYTTNPKRQPGIVYGGVGNEKNPSSNHTVRNNITPTLGLSSHVTSPLVGMVVDHNLVGLNITYDPQKIFQKIDVAHGQYDFHLLPSTSAFTNPAIGTGTMLSVPPVDMAGAVRTNQVDLGVYAAKISPQEQPVSPVSPAPTPTAPTKPVLTYTGSITIIANARLNGTPKLDVLADGVGLGTVNVTADTHIGQVGEYTVNFSTATKPKKIDIILNGYASTVQKYVSLGVFNVMYKPMGGKTTDLLKQKLGQVKSGHLLLAPSTATFETNGDTLEFDVSKL